MMVYDIDLLTRFVKWMGFDDEGQFVNERKGTAVEIIQSFLDSEVYKNGNP